jgi:hypothetical protein
MPAKTVLQIAKWAPAKHGFDQAAALRRCRPRENTIRRPIFSSLLGTLYNPQVNQNERSAALRQLEDVPDHLLTHLSPLGWEHINLTGDYVREAQSARRKTLSD